MPNAQFYDMLMFKHTRHDRSTYPDNHPGNIRNGFALAQQFHWEKDKAHRPPNDASPYQKKRVFSSSVFERSFPTLCLLAALFAASFVLGFKLHCQIQHAL
jgi:hypothetical protein